MVPKRGSSVKCEARWSSPSKFKVVAASDTSRVHSHRFPRALRTEYQLERRYYKETDEVFSLLDHALVPTRRT